MILFIENLISKSITGRMTCARPTSSSASSTPAVAMMCRRLAMKTFITVHQKCETEWHITYIHACTHTRTDAYVVYNYTYNYSYLCIYIYTYYIIYSIFYILYPIYICWCDRGWSSSLHFFYGRNLTMPGFEPQGLQPIVLLPEVLPQLGRGETGTGADHLGMDRDGCTRPGKHTKSYWKWGFIVDFPIKNGDSP